MLIVNQLEGKVFSSIESLEDEDRQVRVGAAQAQGKRILRCALIIYVELAKVKASTE